jgi:hypothetical protein
MKKFLTIFFIALLIGISFGYFWAWSALTKTYEDKLWQKQMIIEHYRTFWSPIRDYAKDPIRKRER